MNTASSAPFDRHYQTQLKHLKLKGLQPKMIEAYSRAIRRIGDYFDHQIDHLTEAQLTDYFSDLVASHSWNTVKLDLYGLKFYTTHVLHQPWVAPGLIRPPKSQRLPDIVTVEEAQRLFAATRVVSYRCLLAEGKPKKVALVACMRKLLTIINAIVKTGLPWNEKLYTPAVDNS